MSNWMIALLLKPLVLLVLFVGVLLPIKIAFQRWMPDGRVKRLLLRRIN